MMLLMEEIVQQVLGIVNLLFTGFCTSPGGATILPSTAGHEHVIVKK